MRAKGANIANHRFLAACRGQPVDATPVWFMRQAGRSLPEYRRLRERHPILELCRTPELAAEVTLQPVRRHGVDAAILFSDIVVPLLAMSLPVDIREGIGPVVADPIRCSAQVDALAPFDLERADYVVDAIRILRRELDVPLIGFVGAPFTLACYLIEGGPSKDHARTRSFMHAEPTAFAQLIGRLADAVATLARAQVEAGAQAMQMFDSWVGVLAPEDYRRHVLPSVQHVFASLGDAVPRIYFGLNMGELLSAIADTHADVIGIDWRVALDEARKRVAREMTLQGNLDPAICLGPFDVVATAARVVLDAGSGGSHVFNLGHGVHPDTDPGILTALVDLVHSYNRDA